MTPDPARTYRVTFYPDERSPDAAQPADLTWDEVAQLLRTPRRTACAPCPGHTCPHKKGPAWSPVDTPRRANSAVRSVSLAVFDLDGWPGGDPLPGRDLRYLHHETHTPGSQRLVVALDQPVPAAEWPATYQRLLDHLGLRGKTDPVCKDVSRLYFLPSKPEGADYSCRVVHGKALSVGSLAGAAVGQLPVRGPAQLPAASPALTEHARQWLRQHGPAVEGAGGDKHTYEVGAYLLNDLALTEEEAWALASEWNATCRPPWEPRALATKLENGLRYATGVRGAKRTDFELLRTLGSYPEPAGAVELIAHAPPTAGASYGAPLLTDEGAETGPRWVVEGVVPAGVPQVVVGHPKSRKTLIAEHLALSVAAGVPWLGRHAVTQGRVLLLLKEDPPPETRRRVWRLARGLGFEPPDVKDWLRVECDAPFYLDRLEYLKRMADTLDEWRPSVLVLDSLSRMHGQDENSMSGMRPVIEAWAELASAFQCAVVAIHHLKKPWGEESGGGGAFGTRMRGTSAIHAMVRHLVGVERDRDADVSGVHVEGNFPGYPDPFQVVFTDSDDQGSKGWTRLGYGGELVRKSLSQGLKELIGGKRAE